MVIDALQNTPVRQRRGIVKEFSRDAERRLVRAATRFFDTLGERRAFWVTLKTRELDPEVAKFLFRKWVAVMRYRLEAHGVFCLEFDRCQFAHYHAVIGIADAHAKVPTTKIDALMTTAWKEVAGQGFDGSCDVQHVYDRKDRSRIIGYMAKRDQMTGQLHRGRWQKAVPAAFAARGIRALWWGSIHGGQRVVADSKPVKEPGSYREEAAKFLLPAHESSLPLAA